MSLRKQRLSRRGIKALIAEEGVVLHAYNDPAGHATVGVGHLIHLGRVTRADAIRWGTSRNPIRRAAAIRLLRSDLKKFEAAVRESVGRRLPQHKFDALVILAFNIGTGGFRSSTVARRVRNMAGVHAIADGFRMWDNPAMLRNRREREIRLYANGTYYDRI